jgi:hypothetical protein
MTVTSVAAVGVAGAYAQPGPTALTRLTAWIELQRDIVQTGQVSAALDLRRSIIGRMDGADLELQRSILSSVVVTNNYALGPDYTTNWKLFTNTGASIAKLSDGVEMTAGATLTPLTS